MGFVICVCVWILSCVGVCMYGFCNVWVCECMGFVMCACGCMCVGFVMCGCVYVWILSCVGVCMYGFCSVWVCMYGFANVCVLVICILAHFSNLD